MEKKNKVRTCGNCAYLVKKDRKNYYYYRVYKCMNEDSDYMGSAWKRPSSPTDCPYHKFKNNLIRCPCYRMFYSDCNNLDSPKDY